MKIGKTLLTADLIERFTSQGYWVDTTTNEAFERNAREFPDKEALVDHRRRLTYQEFYQMVQRLAAHWIGLGLTADDVIAVQLPNWIEYAIVVNSAIIVGIPFCHFHSDFRSKEVEFILDFTGAAVLVMPKYFRKFDHLAMIQDLRPRLPKLKHIFVLGDDIPNDMFDLRAFLESDGSLSVSEEELRRRRPRGNDFARVAFTS
jgi:non-ribosomal peptide synthetase component E (peptide arylation enzyme)